MHVSLVGDTFCENVLDTSKKYNSIFNPLLHNVKYTFAVILEFKVRPF